MKPFVSVSKMLTFIALVCLLPTVAMAQSAPPAPYTFQQKTSMCSTTGVIANTCTEPTVTLTSAFSTAGTYSIQCMCVGGVTGLPLVQSVSEAAASPKVQVIITAQTAATASCTEVDCIASPLNAAAQ